MKELADEFYKAPSGNNVTLEPDFIPWPSFQDRLTASLVSGEQKYQMAVSDSQWLGMFIEGGYYKKLNDIIDADPELQELFTKLNPNLVTPIPPIRTNRTTSTASRRCPTCWLPNYRRDEFCDAGEAAAFQTKYGNALPCTPEEMSNVDWDQVRDFGEFFQRRAGDELAGQALTDDFFGIAYQAGKGYDFSSMQINAFIWQHGASIWDRDNGARG